MMSTTAAPPAHNSTLPRWVGASLAAAGLVNVAAEAITASAWNVRPYSYVQDYVNFLGSPFTGVFQDIQISSPLWFVMTSGWIVTALLIAIAGIGISSALRRGKRITIATLAISQAVALILFAAVPLGQATIDRGLLVLYLLGAFLSIIAGNALAITFGLFSKPLGIPRWLRVLSITLGSLGLVSIAVTYGWMPVGMAERISVYSYLTWAIITGMTLLITHHRPGADITPSTG